MSDAPSFIELRDLHTREVVHIDVNRIVRIQPNQWDQTCIVVLENGEQFHVVEDAATVRRRIEEREAK